MIWTDTIILRRLFIRHKGFTTLTVPTLVVTFTALTEAEEFAQIYNLDTIVVPTNRKVVREDYNDVVYRSQDGKFRAIVEDIKEYYENG